MKRGFLFRYSVFPLCGPLHLSLRLLFFLIADAVHSIYDAWLIDGTAK